MEKGLFSPLKKILSGLLLGLLLNALPSWSQSEELAILPLKHRIPEEVLPTLRPFLAEGAAIQADNNLIIVRTTQENLEQLKTILAQVDRPLQQLLITVKQLSTREAARFRAHIEIPQSNQSRARIAGTGTRDQRSDTQQVRILEGQAALLQTGQSIPLADRVWLLQGGRLLTQNSIRYRDVVSGFEVLPRTNGNRVTLEIRPYQANLSGQGGGRIGMQTLVTQVSIPFGQWFELGGADGTRQQQGIGTVYGTHSRTEELRHIFIRVDKAQ
ncbi:NolW domain protein [Nitrosococcus halophilus Nc 4]|uniref:NolW domain protein n=2 Tax=Nitrosococcus halophilus TaxID=133539 RepID=D5BXU0_NITHN|nr:NolW domain protein [Nitrosococcus halophilus Nc 4]